MSNREIEITIDWSALVDFLTEPDGDLTAGEEAAEAWEDEVLERMSAQFPHADIEIVRGGTMLSTRFYDSAATGPQDDPTAEAPMALEQIEDQLVNDWSWLPQRLLPQQK